MSNRSRLLKLSLLFSALLVCLATLPVSARISCNRYGGCTICDFYGPNDEYQGYIEWCN
jgi:hypothetical protein